MLADLQRIRDRRMKRQQRAVKASELMRLRHRLDIGWIEYGTRAHDGFGRVVVGNESDEFDRHGFFSRSSGSRCAEFDALMMRGNNSLVNETGFRMWRRTESLSPPQPASDNNNALLVQPNLTRRWRTK